LLPGVSTGGSEGSGQGKEFTCWSTHVQSEGKVKAVS
jgi:hypothetical protein